MAKKWKVKKRSGREQRKPFEFKATIRVMVTAHGLHQTGDWMSISSSDQQPRIVARLSLIKSGGYMQIMLHQPTERELAIISSRDKATTVDDTAKRFQSSISEIHRIECRTRNYLEPSATLKQDPFNLMLWSRTDLVDLARIAALRDRTRIWFDGIAIHHLAHFSTREWCRIEARRLATQCVAHWGTAGGISHSLVKH